MALITGNLNVNGATQNPVDGKPPMSSWKVFDVPPEKNALAVESYT
jgi:hypothetical protein